MTDIQLLTADQFRQYQRDGGPCLVDVRSPDEFNAGSEARVCWPVGEINGASVAGFVKQQKLAPEQTVVLVCATGKRALMAAEKLRTLIPNPIAILQGGQANLRGGRVMSIERQVRIAAGSLVVLGALAALFIHPLAVMVCLLIGAGLVFAGITDWCGMGLLLLRMPWNRG
ncbi:MAG TPA: rhodanese-like domain-containing protein [Candidatus Acidoferrum sp.]|nr:rhodanese-like domain-containing protein [Candidatus Acidoferrum sp.]